MTFLFNTYCDSPAHWQTSLQKSASNYKRNFSNSNPLNMEGINKYNYLIDPVFHKLAVVNKSYHDNFKNLSNEELGGLCNHSSFLDKVNEELQSGERRRDIRVFDHNLKLFRNYYGRDFMEVTPMDLNPDTDHQNLQLIFEKVAPTSSGALDFVQILNVRTQINECLYEHTDVLHLSSVKHLAKGISLEKFTCYDKCREAVERSAFYLNDILISTDFTHIINFCETREKMVFLLLYPYFLKPLGKIIWSTLLSHFHFVSGSFTMFMQKVSDLLARKPQFDYLYRTVSVKKVIKLALGFNSVGLLALYNTFLSGKGGQIFLSNHKLYNSLRGFLGSGITFLRLKICR